MNIWHIQHYFCTKPHAKNDLEGAEKDCVAALAVCECQPVSSTDHIILVGGTKEPDRR